jgi:hypothetical protein
MMLLEESQANPLSFSGSQETKIPPLFTPSEKSTLFGQALFKLSFYMNSENSRFKKTDAERI